MSNRSKFAEILSAKFECSKKEGDALLVGFVEALQEQIKNEGEAVLPGFGRLMVKQRSARRGHNPKTGEVIEIAAKSVIGFKPFPGSAPDAA